MMKNLRNKVCLIVTCHVFLCIMVLANGSNNDVRQAYIVYMGEQKNNGPTSAVMDEHHRILLDVVGDHMQAKESRIHSYGKSFNGFVAHLSPQEAAKLRERENVISVFPNVVHQRFTTRSWDFVGLVETIERNSQVESDMIVGVLDTGIYMDLPSFDDKGYGPPPAKWKGKCEKGANFTGCNNKVIGAQVIGVSARNISEDERTPTDFAGHGTHVASTIAGNVVPGANLYGIAGGTTRGGVPSARIAMYKVCFRTGCSSMDILEAIDRAMADGVDVLSISVGEANKPINYFEDPIAIGAFHAQKKGILTICAGGNSGPSFHTVVNVAPWITTVAANGIDREIQTTVKLGNGKSYYGTSLLNTIKLEEHMYPLTNGELAKNANGTNGGNSSACMGGTLSEENVKGAIVHCLGLLGQRDGAISQLHGAGVIISANQVLDQPLQLPTAAAMIKGSDGESIDQYIKSTKSPTAVIHKSTIVKKIAPFIASFSSRGPQTISPNILKPDIAAPGINILAAWTPFKALTQSPTDKRVVKYNIESGTSVACPHASGAAAYVKSFHPEWSPAAIKSAMMTTAKSIKVDPEGGALAYGSGMINPVEAVNPGLIYDIDTDSYLSFLCREGYNSSTLAPLTFTENFDCSKLMPANGTDGLNYPSMHLLLQNQNSNKFSAVFYRTVTNVGKGASLYKANVDSPKELSVSVVPDTLSFTKPNQKLSFKVNVNGMFASETSWLISASLVWSDSSNHNVRSPILVYRNITQVDATLAGAGNPPTTENKKLDKAEL